MAKNLWGQDTTEHVSNKGWEHWAAIRKAHIERVAAQAPAGVHTQPARTSNQVHPSFLTPGRPLTDAEWATKAQGVRARLQAQALWDSFPDDE
jgi:hypothetical protein